MSYIDAGYSIVLGLLFCYGVHLLWRRRRLEAAASRIVDRRHRSDDGS